MTGTIRYSSINSHLGIELSMRDDMESLGYVLIYLATGELPWKGLNNMDAKAKFDKITELKLTTTTQLLCKSLTGIIK